ncbi:SRPBCC domain-containing protein [Amycolatopsis rhabdoformis]|uniref:SRPBCC domain-containing protein n=1 Tax=Amycolatopsis rhabdoformis TaxID=1448059 RepID=A0ABZ1I3M7_9PSEU|nr:SRPBCC domain-containing protein [Amycolatopsis rhabdoformis]WSE28779.1 SRPBCC domain-containing protein [Amycolatopsis rhabdoformis]
MKLGSSFVVPADHKRVFAHFLDPDTMRVAIPGAAELVREDETHYRGKLVNEIAHVKFSAGFSAEITQLTEPEEVKALLKGEDNKLGSSIKIDARLGVQPDGASSSKVDYSLDVAIWGKIGRMGESIVRRRSQEVEREFVASFAEICAAGPPGPDNPGLKSVLAKREAPKKKAAAPAGGASSDAAPVRESWWKRLLAKLFGGKK